MMMTKGTVVNGKIVVEGEPLKEGSVVTILAPERGFKPTPEEKVALLQAIREADAGEVVSGEAVLREIDAV